MTRHAYGVCPAAAKAYYIPRDVRCGERVQYEFIFETVRASKSPENSLVDGQRLDGVNTVAKCGAEGRDATFVRPNVEDSAATVTQDLIDKIIMFRPRYRSKNSIAVEAGEYPVASREIIPFHLQGEPCSERAPATPQPRSMASRAKKWRGRGRVTLRTAASVHRPLGRRRPR